MTEHDYNGIRIKPGHSGEPAGHPTGPYRDRSIWLLQRDDAKLYGYWPTRHAAVGALATTEQFRRTQRPEWFEPRCVPAGSVRRDDVIELNTVDDTKL